MNNRRNFIRRIGVGIAAAITGPNILIAAASDRQRWRRRSSGVLVLNPEWVTAPYVVWISCHPDAFRVICPGNDIGDLLAYGHVV